jgi:hypothetical protein
MSVVGGLAEVTTFASTNGLDQTAASAPDGSSPAILRIASATLLLGSLRVKIFVSNFGKRAELCRALGPNREKPMAQLRISVFAFCQRSVRKAMKQCSFGC